MKPWQVIFAIVVLTIAIWQLWTMLVAYKWPIVIAILVFGIGLVAWLIHRDGKRSRSRR